MVLDCFGHGSGTGNGNSNIIYVSVCVCACYTISTYKYKVNVNIRKLQVHQMQYTCMYDHVCIMDYYGYMLVRPYIRSLSCLLRGVSENGGTPRIQSKE